MTPLFTMRESLNDPQLLGGMIAGESWAKWRVALIAANGEQLDDAERAIFRDMTGGREREPGERVEQFVAVVGRRGGKDRAISCAAAYYGALCDYSDVLAPGERGVVLALAQNQKQAAVAFNYTKAIFENVPKLRKMVKGRPTADSISLKTGIDIEIRAASFRGLRGPTYVFAIGDEIAFWYIEGSSNPDHEIINAVLPGLSTTGGMLTLISSPYAKRGVLYETCKDNYGPGGDPRILVVKGASRDFNPTLRQSIVDRAYEKDAENAAAEYGGEFRSDLEDFVSRELVESLIERGVTKREPLDGVAYFGFCDPSGGSKDAMTGAVAHLAGRTLVLDALMEIKAPFSPESATKRLAEELFRPYRIAKIRGDRYAGEWPRERFAANNIEYIPADMTRSEIYLSVLPEMNSANVSLLDHSRMIAQFCGLERRTSRAGRDTIDHKPGSHDDICNSVAGALLLAKPFAAHETDIGRPATVEFEGFGMFSDSSPGAVAGRIW